MVRALNQRDFNQILGRIVSSSHGEETLAWLVERAGLDPNADFEGWTSDEWDAVWREVCDYDKVRTAADVVTVEEEIL